MMAHERDKVVWITKAFIYIFPMASVVATRLEFPSVRLTTINYLIYSVFKCKFLASFNSISLASLPNFAASRSQVGDPSNFIGNHLSST